MEPKALQDVIVAGLPDCSVEVTGDGSHFEARVIGAVFAGQSLVKRQQLVYATLGDRISTGEVHAISIKTHTPEEWQALQ